MKFDFMGYNVPYIVGDVELKFDDIVLEKETDEGTYFVKKSNIEGIFTCGFKQKQADYLGNPAGYVWSSRACVMNKIFGIALTEVVYKKENSHCPISCAMDLAHLEPLLEGTEYMIDWTPRKDDTDICYKVIKRSKSPLFLYITLY